MTRSLDFFFFIGSTYTCLAVQRAEAVAARQGVVLRWRPFSVRSIMVEQNNKPFVGKPGKLAYMWRDIERRAARHGLPFSAAPVYPIDADELANRVATLASMEGWCPEFTRAACSKWFLGNQDPGATGPLSDILRDLNRDPDAVIAQANAQAVRDRYAARTQAARALAIFGSPTFVYGSEIFWGDDRLEDAIDWCLSH